MIEVIVLLLLLLLLVMPMVVVDVMVAGGSVEDNNNNNLYNAINPRFIIKKNTTILDVDNVASTLQLNYQ